MNKILEILNQLETSKTNDKIKIISKNKDNELFKKILYYTYNPDLQYGFSEDKLREGLLKNNNNLRESKWNNLFDMLDELSSSNINDKLRINTYSFITTAPDEYKELYIKVLTKDLRCNIQIKTINKAIKNLIPTFGVMLADKYYNKMDKVEGKEFIITTKLDGGRCVLIKDNNGKAIFKTRQGKIIDGLVEFKEDIDKLPNGIVLDGELLAINKNNLHSKDLYSVTMKESRKKGNKHDLQLNVFDIIPYNEFISGVSSKNAFERKEILHNLIEQNQFTNIIEVKVLYKGNDINKIEELLNEITSKGGEGIMINLDSPYETKRTSNILKVKKFQEADVRVLDILEGNKSNSGKLGAIKIQFEYKDKLYTCECGSGFTQEERELYWQHPELLINKIVTIKYFEISQDSKTKEYGLRFPIWTSRIREDKDEISMY